MKKVMIIDDEFDILDVLERYLSKSGKYEILTFANPIDALKELKKNRYDLVLSDVMMPQVSGLDILSEIKNHNKDIKIILMTAYSTKLNQEKSQQLNVDKYLEKPFLNLRIVEDAISALI